MSIISANTFFHFTKKSNLLSILVNGFYPRVSFEEVKFDKETYLKAGIPMVSFCDIPLSQIKIHVKHYGSYGIGMSKEWGERNKINPVLYLKKGSTLANNVASMTSSLASEILKGFKELREPKRALLEMLRYIKAYEGILERDEMKYEKKFYNEREWRYVSNPQDYGSNKYFFSESELNDPKIMTDVNSKLEKAKLGFEPDDIRYIIVKNQSAITDMILHLKYKAEKFKYDDKTMQLLTSKILTYEQIKEDF